MTPQCPWSVYSQRQTSVTTSTPGAVRNTAKVKAGDMVVLAARPSMGKTAFAMNIAKYAGVRNHKRVLVLSLEMSKEQLVQRLLCAEGRVDSHKVRTGYLDTRDWTSLTNAAGRLAEAPIFIDDSPSIGVLEMRAKCRRLAAEHGLNLVIVDYIQLIPRETQFNRPAGTAGSAARSVYFGAHDLPLADGSRAAPDRRCRRRRPLRPAACRPRRCRRRRQTRLLR